MAVAVIFRLPRTFRFEFTAVAATRYIALPEPCAASDKYPVVGTSDALYL